MQVLYALESVRTPFFDTVMSVITRLGEETVFMVVALFVFWCVSKRHGYYLLAVGFAGTVLNQFLKLLCRIPRPWVLDSNFTIVESARAQATGYSFPSGHAQNAVGTFGGIARFARRKWVRVTAIVIAVMIALSVGYLLFVSRYRFPADVDAENLAFGVENAWKLLGATLGLLAAWWLDVTFIHFDTRAVWYVQAIKLVGGLALTVAIKAGLKAPLIALLGAEVGGAVRYAVMVLFAGAVWPMTFHPLCCALKKQIY